MPRDEERSRIHNRGSHIARLTGPPHLWSNRVTIGAYLLCPVLVFGAILAGGIVYLNGWPYRLAVFGHLMSLVLGFGAVLVLDVYGLRRIRNKDAHVISVVHLANVLDIGVWVGFVGLLATGALLHPHVHAGWFQIKMVAVLAAMWNGVSVQALNHRLYGHPPTSTMSDLPKPLLRRMFAAVVVSTLAWWVAVCIGFFANVDTTA